MKGVVMPTTWLDTVLRQTRRAGEFPYPHWAELFLDNPIRRFIDRPAAVVERLDLAGAERVLELGPGPGFYSTEIARRVPQGQLDLFDIQPEMLDKARRNLENAGFRNVGFHAGDASGGFPFPDSHFDVAFLAAVLGEVPDKSACIRELARVLRPGGSLVLVESFPDPDRLSVQTLRDLAEPEGFALHVAAGTTWRDVVHFLRVPAP
jgi:ubiquinone/menaquinone biosynthesis C-methylase UbiE